MVILNDASCSGNLCIAGGASEDFSDFNVYPLMALSQNGGTSWTYPIEFGSAALPANFTAGGFNSTNFNAVSCTGAMCIGAGNYTATDSALHPMLAQTLDGGATWSYALDMTHGPQPTGFSNNATLSGASCSASICVAGGIYTATDTKAYPFLVQSTDNGSTGPR